MIEQRAVIIGLDAPIPLAYINIYEEGDMWMKAQGCDACSKESRIKCCNNCALFSADGECGWHLKRNQATARKPWNCIVKPYPDASMMFCALEFECVEGSRKGQIRRVQDPGDVFQTE